MVSLNGLQSLAQCQSGHDLLGDGSVLKHVQEKGHGLTPAWGDEATINILFAEFHQGAAEITRWICSEFSVQSPASGRSSVYTLGSGNFLSRRFGDAALGSMQAHEKATFIVNAVTMEESICRPTATWMFKNGYERVDVERYCVCIQVLEVKSSPVVDLWQEALEITGSGLTMRRPSNWCKAQKDAKQVLSLEWWKAEVSLEMEVRDCVGRVVVPHHSVKGCVQGSGTLPDIVEIALLRLQPGQSCEVCCQKLSFCTWDLAEPNLPLYLRIWMISRSKASAGSSLEGLQEVLQHAKLLIKQKRFLLALLKLRSLCNTPAPLERFNEETLKLLCICEHRLGLPAKESADALVKCRFRSKNLVLRARIRLSSEPALALCDLKTASQLDPTFVSSELVRRAKQQLKRQRRAARWFDGHGVDERIEQASSPYICNQCNRLRNGHKGEPGSKMEGKYFCEDCWKCWSTIRHSQQKELTRQVEKATYSDYSTGTDELPSLDDTPQDWDSRHPMWNRENVDRPNWQRLHAPSVDFHHSGSNAWPARATSPAVWGAVD